MIEITASDWAAWAPGLHTRQEWQRWALAPVPPVGDAMPVLDEVPAMQRRRIEQLGRMAVQVAYWCGRAGTDAVPMVFCSRHGDVRRSLEMLEQGARGEPLSPTRFGLSVHNAIAALYSIVRGVRGNCIALAAGQAGAETAVVEAAGLLADGAHEVLVVVYEAALPSAYAGFADEPAADFAWACRLRPPAAADGDDVRLVLDWRAEAQPLPAVAGAELPASLAALRFLVAGQSEYAHHADGLRWRWRRQPAAA